MTTSAIAPWLLIVGLLPQAQAADVDTTVQPMMSGGHVLMIRHANAPDSCKSTL